MLDLRRIYLEPAAADLPRGRAVLDRFPDAERIPVDSHWRIPELHGAETTVDRWVRIKTESLVLGTKKSLSARPNGRSADFIAPSTANGCTMACAYCYLPRRKGYANPITVFANIEQITGYLSRHVGRQGRKTEPNQVDPAAWVYDIGESSDRSVDALVSDNVRDLVTLFRGLPSAKASFATKHVNRDLLGWDPAGRTRIRFSLMPDRVARLLGGAAVAAGHPGAKRVRHRGRQRALPGLVQAGVGAAADRADRRAAAVLHGAVRVLRPGASGRGAA